MQFALWLCYCALAPDYLSFISTACIEVSEEAAESNSLELASGFEASANTDWNALDGILEDQLFEFLKE